MAAPGLPPAADRGDREDRGVVIDANVDPAGVRRKIVDSIRDGGFARRPGEEAVAIDSDRVTLPAPLPTGVRQLAEHLLLLRVHADDGLVVGLVSFDLLVDVAKLGVPVRVLLALQGLGLGLEAESVVLQQPAHRHRRDGMALARQLVREDP